MAYTYPGVYIEEFTPGAPIQGVGTSTAAFIGPAARGEVNAAVKITSWDQFKQEYGDLPLDGFYTWYAVRGFFENGGTVCYIVRATNGDYDEVTVKDNAAAMTPAGTKQDTVVIRARELGDHTPDITVKASASNLLTDAQLYRPGGPSIVSVSGQEIKTDDAAKAALFQPTDVIAVGGTSYTVARVVDDTIMVTQPVTGAPTGAIRLADTVAGTTTSFRVDEATGLKIGAGSVLQLSAPQLGAPPTPSTVVVKRVTPQQLTPALRTYRVELRSPVTTNFDMSKKVRLDSFEFKLEVLTPAGTGPYDHLSMDPAHPNYFADVIARDPAAIITAAPATPPSKTKPPFNQPVTATAGVPLAGGADDDPTKLTAAHYSNALDVLDAVDDVNLLCAPDSQQAAVQLALIGHCEDLKDRFAILDSKIGLTPFGATGVGTQRNALQSPDGYAALYYPWIYVAPGDPSATRNVLVPPSGHVAGIYARTDEDRGVHKAPAGTQATVRQSLGVEVAMSEITLGQLNLDGINVIRTFRPGGQPVVWGAGTLARMQGVGGNTNWQYVSTRRLFEYLEESIMEGISWSVFEPHNPELWQKLKRTITDFLTRAWNDGALDGATAEQAFYVRIDDALNPPDLKALGELHIEIGCQPAYPAEFVVVAIGIWDGGSEVTEV